MFRREQERWVAAPEPAGGVRVSVDFALTIEVWSQLRLRIDTPCELTTPDGDRATLDPDSDPTSCAPALSLVGSDITHIQITDTGDLDVHFTGGSALRAHPHPQLDAWQLWGRGNAGFVCAAGGRLETAGSAAPPM